jgi:hypothetical protein
LKSVVLLSLPLSGASHGDLRAAESAVTALPPFAEPLQGTASDAVVRPPSDAHGVVLLSAYAPHCRPFSAARASRERLADFSQAF